MSRRAASSRRALVLAWAPAVLYMALIWALSSLPIDVPLDYVPGRDKGIHLVEYSALGFFTAHATLRTWPRLPVARPLLVAVFITIGWGLLDELHQSTVPGRFAEVMDLVADTVGAFAGSLAYLGARTLNRMRKREAPA